MLSNSPQSQYSRGVISATSQGMIVCAMHKALPAVGNQKMLQGHDQRVLAHPQYLSRFLQ